jgi:hypothetical protein
MTSSLVLPILLSACSPEDPGDTGTPTGEIHPVGDVFDLPATATGVGGEIPDAGTYVVILFSAAADQDRLFGYGTAAGEASRTGLARPRRLPASGAPGPTAARGGRRSFRVWNGEAAVTVEAEADFVTDELVIWRDVTTESPLGDIDEDTLDGVIERFEGIVLPRMRQEFGEESDVDGSGRIDVLLSYTVNQYGAVAYVSWCDIAAIQGCGSWGNDGEILYMGIPDPESSYSSPNAITEVWAHEMTHLVYAWHKWVGTGQLDARENVYVTEGMSALAQDITGYNNGNQYVWAAAIDMRDYYEDEEASIQGVSINDILRGSSSYATDRDGTLRGAVYLFLRYLFEQAGGMTVSEAGTLTDAGGFAWLHAWLGRSEMGAACAEATTGRALEDLALDWYTALVVTGRDLNDDPRWNYQDRVQDPLTTFEFGVDPFATIHGWLTLRGPPVQPLTSADGEIRAGGVEYLETVLDTPGRIDVPVDPDALPKARVFRIE